MLKPNNKEGEIEHVEQMFNKKTPLKDEKHYVSGWECKGKQEKKNENNLTRQFANMMQVHLQTLHHYDFGKCFLEKWALSYRQLENKLLPKCPL